MNLAAPVLPASAAPSEESTPPRARNRRGRALAALVVAGVLGALLFWALAVGHGDPVAVPAGLAGAGLIVDWGLPLVTLAGRVAAVGTVGTLVFAAVLRPGRDGTVPAESRRALRATAAWALGWAVATAVGGLLALGRLLGSASAALSWGSLRVFVEDTGAGRAALLVVALAGVVAAGAPRCTAAGARILLAVALSALVLPVVLSGHSSAAADHLPAVTTLGVHVVATTVWVGGLLALLVHGRRGAGAATRFSRVALACFLATAVSGVLAAWLVLGGGGALLAALGTGYGTLLLAKTAGLGLLGALGWQHRRRTLPRLRAGDGRAFRRFAIGEVLLMLATVTLAVALAATPPPVDSAATGAAPGTAGPTAPAAAAATDPMTGHDHGELSVGVLVDDTRFHVAGPVTAGSRVTVHNGTEGTVTITAIDGSFDVVLPPRTLTTFLAPQRPGAYPFTSAHSASFADVLVVG